MCKNELVIAQQPIGRYLSMWVKYRLQATSGMAHKANEGMKDNASTQRKIKTDIFTIYTNVLLLSLFRQPELTVCCLSLARMQRKKNFALLFRLSKSTSAASPLWSSYEWLAIFLLAFVSAIIRLTIESTFRSKLASSRKLNSKKVDAPISAASYQQKHILNEVEIV